MAWLQTLGGLGLSAGGMWYKRRNYMAIVGESLLRGAANIRVPDMLAFVQSAQVVADASAEPAVPSARPQRRPQGSHVAPSCTAVGRQDLLLFLVEASVERTLANAEGREGDAADVACRTCGRRGLAVHTVGGKCICCTTNSLQSALHAECGSRSVLDMVRLLSCPRGVYTLKGVLHGPDQICMLRMNPLSAGPLMIVRNNCCLFTLSICKRRQPVVSRSGGGFFR